MRDLILPLIYFVSIFVISGCVTKNSGQKQGGVRISSHLQATDPPLHTGTALIAMASSSDLPSSPGLPRIESIGEQAVIPFDAEKELPIYIEGQDIGLLPDTAWAVQVGGVEQAIRGLDYDFRTLANSPSDKGVGYNKAAIVLQPSYLQKVHDGDFLTVDLEISGDSGATIPEIEGQVASAESLYAKYQTNQASADALGLLTNQIAFVTRLFPTEALRDAPDYVQSMDIQPNNIDGFIHAFKSGLEKYHEPVHITLASGARQFQLFTTTTYRTSFLQKEIPLSDIQAFPIPEEQVKQLLGPDVADHFYVISLSLQNNSDQDRIINAGLIKAYGRVIVLPTNSLGPEFTIPVEISPQSSSQVYTTIANHKPNKPREVIFRALDFAGSLATAIATGFNGAPDLIKALGVATGVGEPGLKTLFPDPVPGFLQNIVLFSMPELVKVPRDSSIGFQLLFFSKDNLNGIISDAQIFQQGQPPDQRLAFLSFDTLEIPFETANQPFQALTNGPPIVTTPPVGTEASEGQAVRFSVVAAGVGPMSYQWLFNGTNMSGETNSTLFIKNATPANVGRYSVIVSNSAGSVTSTEAVLAVSPGSPPIIIIQPSAVNANAGKDATFAVNATGDNPLSYQWYFSGSKGPVGASAQLTLTNVIVSEAGSYHVVVTNFSGAATSAVVQLTVQPN